MKIHWRYVTTYLVSRVPGRLQCCSTLQPTGSAWCLVGYSGEIHYNLLGQPGDAHVRVMQCVTTCLVSQVSGGLQ